MQFPKPTRTKKSKMKEWEDARKELKIEFEAKGITSCELGLPGCMRDNFLTFAHAKKRRKLEDGELKVVALLCQNCHNEIEYLPAAKMEAIVMNIINNR